MTEHGIAQELFLEEKMHVYIDRVWLKKPIKNFK